MEHLASIVFSYYSLFVLYIIVGIVWFYAIEKEYIPTNNLAWLVSWTFFLPMTISLIVYGFIDMMFEDFIDWLKKEI